MTVCIHPPFHSVRAHSRKFFPRQRRAAPLQHRQIVSFVQMAVQGEEILSPPSPFVPQINDRPYPARKLSQLSVKPRLPAASPQPCLLARTIDPCPRGTCVAIGRLLLAPNNGEV